MEDFSGTTWEDPLAGDHFEVARDTGLEVVLRGTDTDTVRVVDARRFPGRLVPE